MVVLAAPLAAVVGVVQAVPVGQVVAVARMVALGMMAKAVMTVIGEGLVLLAEYFGIQVTYA